MPSSGAVSGDSTGDRDIVLRSEGVTPSEQYLKRLCDRSFLSLWSYPGVYRDQGRINAKGDGKELADLLVVFENHILIFSDKHIHFEETENIEVGWGRWFRKAVLASAKQVWGAERWIREFPHRLFLDRGCQTPFPIEVPDPNKAIFHRIVVAHDASRVCRLRFGGSGSLMLDSHLIGEEQHLRKPFVIGRIDGTKGYVHVFDDTSLDVVMGYLDTVSDLVSYLTKKERFLTGAIHVRAAGEEELLGEYVKWLNKDGEHDFVIPQDVDHVLFPEGMWQTFLSSQERKAQLKANEVSFLWDEITEKFLHHLMSGTQYSCNDPRIREQEKSFRWLARECRTRRRMLARGLLEVLEKTPWDHRATRIIKPSRPGDPYFVFLLLPYYHGLAESEYRQARAALLREHMLVVKLQYPDARHVVGIATETRLRDDYRSEDFLHVDVTEWNADLEALAQRSKDDLGIFTNVTTSIGREQEYPVDIQKGKRAVLSRNSPCFCNSGKRFKRCHGEGMHTKKKGKLFRDQ